MPSIRIMDYAWKQLFLSYPCVEKQAQTGSARQGRTGGRLCLRLTLGQNTKSQTPSFREIPSSKFQNALPRHRLELGIWSFFGVWSLILVRPLGLVQPIHSSECRPHSRSG